VSDDLNTIDWCERELAEQRAANARGYARAEALVELRGLLIEWAAERHLTYLTADEMIAAPRTEEDRTRLKALLDVILPDVPPTPAEEAEEAEEALAA
jgi:hypothetical protein